MKVTNKGFDFIILNGLTQDPIELKQGESRVIPEDQLTAGHESVYSVFDPEALIFDKSVQTEEKQPATKPVEEVKPVEPAVEEVVKEPVETSEETDSKTKKKVK